MFYSWVVCTVYCAVLPAFSFYQKSYDSVPILGEKQYFMLEINLCIIKILFIPRYSMLYNV